MKWGMMKDLRPGSNQIIPRKSTWKSVHWTQSDNRRITNYRDSADCGKQLITYGWPSLDRWAARYVQHTGWPMVWCRQTATHYLKRCWPCHKPQVAGATGAQDAWATMSWIKKWYKYRLSRNWNKTIYNFSFVLLRLIMWRHSFGRLWHNC